jgi:hypothetical protein
MRFLTITCIFVQACSSVRAPLALKSLSMKEEGVRSGFARKSKGLMIGLALMFGVVAPRNADAAGEDYAMMSADGTSFMEPALKKTGPDFARMGASAAVAVVSFGGMSAFAIKKSKEELALGLETFEGDVKRMENFKQEFLDGIPSDNSLMASLSKAMTKPEAKAKPAEKEEDEFDKNVRLYLEEEQAKDDKKKGKKSEGPDAKGGATLLDRPGDPDGTEADAWMNEVEFEDKPATVDDEKLKALQRMFGSGPEAAGSSK